MNGLQAFTPAQADLVSDWLEHIAYKPGFRFGVDYNHAVGAIIVRFEALLFDSTKATRTKIVRNRSIRVAVPARLGQPWAHHGDDVIEELSYELGPDLVGGPLVVIGRTTELPIYLEVKSTKAALAHFLTWLRSQLWEFEAHEADEWFRDADTGVPFNDPHAKP